MAAKSDIEKCNGWVSCGDACPVEAIKVNDQAKINEVECPQDVLISK